MDCMDLVKAGNYESKVFSISSNKKTLLRYQDFFWPEIYIFKEEKNI